MKEVTQYLSCKFRAVFYSHRDQHKSRAVASSPSMNSHPESHLLPQLNSASVSLNPWYINRMMFVIVSLLNQDSMLQSPVHHVLMRLLLHLHQFHPKY